jgi:subtilisin family serine protease
VSGTIGAKGNNSLGVVGVNWTASLMGAKFLGADGSGTTADEIDAIEFTILTKQFFAPTRGANVRVLNANFGSSVFSQAELDEINRANDNAMLLVAAGNNILGGKDNDVIPEWLWLARTNPPIESTPWRRQS